MITKKSLLFVLVFSILLASFGGAANVRVGVAQAPTPPILSSPEEQPSQSPPAQIDLPQDDPSTDFPEAGLSLDTGITSGVLWHQPIDLGNSNVYIAQEFPDEPVYSSYLADDFLVEDSWNIETIFVPGSNLSGFTSLLNANALNWKIYRDNSGFPAGDPGGGGDAPVWSLSLVPTSPSVSLSTGTSGHLSSTLLNLPDAITLSPGRYWLVFYPTLAFNPYGQFGLQPADTSNEAVAKFINPGDGFGYGTGWNDWTILGMSQQDLAFSIGGTKGAQWKSIPPFNGLGRSRSAAASVDGKVYLIGGEITSGLRADTVERYDPATMTWETLPGLMPTPASNICAGVIGTDIYIPGGYDVSLTALNTLQVFHTTSNTWSVVSSDPMPDAFYGMGCAVEKGKLYVFGGSNAGGYRNTAYVYDPVEPAGSRWTSIASMTHARGYLAGVSANGKIYAIGGRDGGTSDFDFVEAYNPTDGLWHPVTDLTIARGGVGAYAVGDTIYVCGGGWSAYYNSCESYNTTQGYSGAWEPFHASMIQSRRTFGYTNVGSTLYAVGGWSGDFMATGERWSYEVFLPLVNKPLTVVGFDSQFNNDFTGWEVATGIWTINPTNVSTTGLTDYWSSIYHNQTFANLDYSARMMRLGDEYLSNNIMIRGTPTLRDSLYLWNDVYMFQYSRSGYYSVWKSVGGVDTPLQLWTYTDAINTGDNWNTLRVVASGRSLYFYINNTLLWFGLDDSLSEGKVGVGMYGEGFPSDKLIVDWATLYSGPGGIQVTDTVSPAQQALNDAANLNGIGNARSSGE